MKRIKFYLIWSVFYLVIVILAIKYLPEIYKTIFLYVIIIFLAKDFFIDFILKKGVWPSWSEHMPFQVIVFFLWMSGYVSHLLGFLAFTDAVLDFWLDQKKLKN